ncbi:hypothetical protein YH64_011980 [Achromobacter sp. LC458]|uniref:hypothetical protein n=1 Tax=Achromobacter sp. LC458 TaxID=1120623 RepID=UPI00062A2571|nr:hypothetical protein [Achromobacter sp. LC458]TRM52842.1 hypothetical protein YH64_011980 [Achromobacter sp. LC458]
MQTKKDHYAAICADMFWDAFGPEGIATLAYWYGAQCRNALMQEWTRFPLMQVYGQPSTGKDTLIEFLWKLLGRDCYLGWMLHKTTPAALARKLDENDGRPVVLIELDSAPEGFELINVFAGNLPYEVLDHTSGRPSKQHWFNGAALFVPEAQHALPPELQHRMVNVQLCHRSKDAAAQLEMIPVDLLTAFSSDAQRSSDSGAGLITRRAAMHRQALTNKYRLRDQILLDTYSRVMGMVDALTLVVPLSRAQLDTTMNLLAHAATQQNHRSDMAASMSGTLEKPV